MVKVRLDEVGKIAKQLSERREFHLDFFAAAVQQATGLSADQLKLVERHEGTQISWHFEKKD